MDHDAAVDPTALLGRAVATWRKAQVVHQAPAYDGWPEARALAERLARHPEVESGLTELLSNPNQLVVAYSLMTLDLMGSPIIQQIPPSVLQNRSNLPLLIGSIRHGTNLGRFARELLDRSLRVAATTRQTTIAP